MNKGERNRNSAAIFLLKFFNIFKFILVFLGFSYTSSIYNKVKPKNSNFLSIALMRKISFFSHVKILFKNCNFRPSDKNHSKAKKKKIEKTSRKFNHLPTFKSL